MITHAFAVIYVDVIRGTRTLPGWLASVPWLDLGFVAAIIAVALYVITMPIGGKR
jgi:hypothetical protein